MENTPAGVTPATDPNATPEQIEREMIETRDSLTEKVSLLESQMMGNIQSVTTAVDSVKGAVSDTVQAVKDAVSSAPSAMNDTVKQTVAAVKDTVRETIASVDVSDYVRRNPWAAVGASAAVGFVASFILSGGRSGRSLLGRGYSGGSTARPMAALGDTAYGAHTPAAAPGLFGGLMGTLGNELRQLAEEALKTGLASVKKNIGTEVPHLIDNAIHQVTEKISNAATLDPEAASRVGGSQYAAAAPPRGR